MPPEDKNARERNAVKKEKMKKKKKLLFLQNSIPNLKKGLVVLGAMVVKNVKNQYRRSVLGVLWTVLNPLLTMIVIAVVFSSIFGRVGIGMDYPVYVLAGNIVFGLMRSATTMALPSMVQNYDLFTKTKVPFIAFPTASVCTATVNFLFSLIALFAVMLFRIPNGITFRPTLLLIFFPWLPALFFFSLGLSLLLCSVYVRFRDIQHFYNVFLTLWLYMTPVFYSLETLTDKNVERPSSLIPCCITWIISAV